MTRYFIALLLPQPLQDRVIQIQQHFAEQYGSCKALNSPPHITLQPPLDQSPEQVAVLLQALSRFVLGRFSITVELSGFGAFIPRVIYVNVLQTAELLRLQSELAVSLQEVQTFTATPSNQRPYVPHVTVAFRDLTTTKFWESWPIWQQQPFKAKFLAKHLTLLRHTGQVWVPEAEFSLGEM